MEHYSCGTSVPKTIATDNGCRKYLINLKRDKNIAGSIRVKIIKANVFPFHFMVFDVPISKKYEFIGKIACSIKDLGILTAISIYSEFEQTSRARVFGIDYHHLSLAGGDDLYVTEYGLPFIENLLPENFWTDKVWFKNHSQRLRGTSTIYKIATKEVNGKSKDIVMKWNRMGQDIPGSLDVKELNLEFNSPFEEFALVTELRNRRYISAIPVYTHKPLAIYVPAAHTELGTLTKLHNSSPTD